MRDPAATAIVTGTAMGWAGPVFWPHASDDMFDYVLLANGTGERFWAYGPMLHGVFADLDSHQGVRAVAVEGTSEGPSDGEPSERPAIAACGGAQDSSSPDGVLARIERTVHPSPAQLEHLESLQTALAQASARINESCRANRPNTPPERLDAMQDRIGAMHDALLTIRLPLERLYNSLDEEQKARLSDSAGGRPSLSTVPQPALTLRSSRSRIAPRSAGDPRENASATKTCGSMAVSSNAMGGIERGLQLSNEQHALWQALRMRLAELTRLITSSCPAHAGDTPLDRLSAANDRLTVMLFAVMTIGPSLQSFYDSLSDQQKGELGRLVRQRLPPDRTARASASRAR